MARTPEQIAADDALEAAITHSLKVYRLIDEGWSLGDFIITVEMMPFTEKDAGTTKYADLIPGEDGIPWHRLLGLAEALRVRLQKAMLEEHG